MPTYFVRLHALRCSRWWLTPPLCSPAGDDEQVSTALGHVAHLVTLIAKYLQVWNRCCLAPRSRASPVPWPPLLVQVPLRYAIHCVGSRSIIRDDVLRPGEQFPLFAKSQDRQRFVVAVRFLQLNITQVCPALPVRVPRALWLRAHVRNVCACPQLVAATGVSTPVPDNSAMLPKLLALFAHLLGPVLAFEARYEGKLAT